MTTSQKVIKYCAIAFFLIVTIISVILSVIYGLASALGLKKETTNETGIINLEGDLTAYLDVELPLAQPTPTKSIDEIAKDVIAGKYGNYPERKVRLEAEGYNYNEVQGRVDAMLAGSTPAPAPAPAPIGVGESVIVTGVGTSSSDGSGSITRIFTNHRMKVIAIRNNASHPYACNQYNEGIPGDYSKVTAWFNADSVKRG